MVTGSSEGIGRAGEGVVVLYVVEGSDCTKLTVINDMVESLWIRIKRQANNVDVVGVYNRSPS